MKKRYLSISLGFFLVLTPFLSVSPAALLALITADTDDSDSTIAAIELRPYLRVFAKEDTQHFGDINIPEGNRAVSSFLSIIPLQHSSLNPPSFDLRALAQIRAPPALAHIV